MATAFENKDCRSTYTSISRITRFFLDCEWPEIPDLELNRNNPVLQQVSPVNTVYFNFNGGGGGGCTPETSSGSRIVDSQTAPRIGSIWIDSEQGLMVQYVVDELDSCGVYIRTVSDGDPQSIANVGDCPT